MTACGYRRTAILLHADELIEWSNQIVAPAQVGAMLFADADGMIE
jgi:hypothetical protein